MGNTTAVMLLEWIKYRGKRDRKWLLQLDFTRGAECFSQIAEMVRTAAAFVSGLFYKDSTRRDRQRLFQLDFTNGQFPKGVAKENVSAATVLKYLFQHGVKDADGAWLFKPNPVKAER